VRHGPLVEQILQGDQLLSAETRLGPGRAWQPTRRLASQASPATQSGARNAKDPSDDAGRSPPSTNATADIGAFPTQRVSLLVSYFILCQPLLLEVFSRARPQ